MSVKTTGELREFLANIMIGVKNGHVKPDEAARITKLAAQINESFYAEIKVKRVLRDAEEQTAQFGKLAIGKDAP